MRILLAVALTFTFAGCSAGRSSIPSQTVDASARDRGPSTALRGPALSQAYLQAVLASLPLAYYRLNDSGGVALDSSGNGLNGTVGANVTTGVRGIVPSSTDTAMVTSGAATAAGTIDVPPAALLRPTGAVSVEAFLHFSAIPTTYSVLVAYGSDRGYAPYDLYFNGGKLEAQFATSAGVLVVGSPAALRTHTTYDAVSTYDGTTGSLYLNGILVASAQKAGTITGYDSTHGLAIGDDAAFSDPGYAGTVGEVAIYGRALSSAEVAAHFLAAKPALSTPTPLPTATATATASAAATATPTATPSASPTPRPTATPTAKATATPTATPRPSPTPTSSPGTNVATYDGCSIFTAGDVYNADITNAAPDPHSANYIASVTATDSSGFYASTGYEQLNVATSSTKLYTVHQDVSYHSFPVPYPWANGFYIEPAGDGHAMVLLQTPPACHLYEAYNTAFSNNVLSAYSGANWDLSKPFVVQAGNSPSAMASGLSLFAGMVKFEEIASGIHHALNFTLFAGTPCDCYTAPASDTDGLSYRGPPTVYALPYGAHLRLKASFDDSHFGPQSKAIAEALKHYGGYLADTSNGNNALYTSNPTSGGSWNGNDLGSLGAITPSDFDVLPVGTTVAR